MRQTSIKWERAVLKWRDLAERRHAYCVELFKSGRWRRYYSETEFRAELRDAIAMAERWAELAPTPGEHAAAADVVTADSVTADSVTADVATADVAPKAAA